MENKFLLYNFQLLLLFQLYRELKLQEHAKKCFKILGAKGWGRLDIMLDKENNPWIIELNTIPGMTNHSLVPMAAKQAGIDFDSLVLEVLDTSFE